MKDSGGNQCGLKTDVYSACQMEIDGDKPGWSKCPFNTKENGKKIAGNLEKIKVFPREFRPSENPKEKGESWEGILLKDWMIYMDKIPKE